MGTYTWLQDAGTRHLSEQIPARTHGLRLQDPQSQEDIELGRSIT